jgi:rare lipoprotein A
MQARLCLLAMAALMAVLASCGTARTSGGYYQKDGLPAQLPPDVATAKDAVPKVEPLHPFANRAYVALGRTYTPMNSDQPFRQRGKASWYGRQFHGKRTSSGEVYDMFAMTAAHPTLPLPSFVRVTSVKNGTEIIVRVNDRGPFVEDRIIDLSYAAAARLGIAGPGTGEVQIERLTNTVIASGLCCQQAAGSAPVAAASPSPLAEATEAARPVQHWAVQLGAFAQPDNAEAMRMRVAADLRRQGVSQTPRIEWIGNLFRVLLGESADRAQAVQAAQQLERTLNLPTMLVMY